MTAPLSQAEQYFSMYFNSWYFSFPDIGLIEKRIFESIWSLYSVFPMDNECDQKKENQSLCRNLLKSSQSSMSLAVGKWRSLLVKINRYCRTNILLKGILSGQLTFYIWKSSFCWVQRHIFYPNPSNVSPPNQAISKVPGTSSALKSGYPEE